VPPNWSSRPALCVGQDAEVAGIETGVPSAEPSAYLEDATSASLVPAEARLRLLAEATAHLADTLDVRAVAQGVARTVVPTLAETVHVDLVESLFHPEGGTVPDSTVLLRVAAVNDLGPATGLEEWVAYPPGSPAAGALAGVTSGEVSVDGEGTERLFVPLRARGRVLGVVGLHRREPSAAFPPADIALVEEIATRAALALDNVRLYDEARATAVALQRSLLPRLQPRVTGVDSAQRYLPGRRDLGVGGDWFDVIPLSCGRVAFVIGDVMGRGLRAAAAMGQLRTAVRMLAVLDPMPEDVLRHLDDLAQGTDEVQLATCVYAVFDPVEGSLSYASAGHPPPLLHEPGTPTAVLPQPSGAPLGVGGVPFESHDVSVPDGARLVLYTDGLVESRDVDIDDGLRRLGGSVENGSDDLETLCDEVLDRLGRSDDHDDDVALLVARLTGLRGDRVARWHCQGGVESVSGARAWARTTLGGWDLGDGSAQGVTELAELLVSELVTNALRHASGRIELTALLLDEALVVSVSDGDQPLPRLRRVHDSDEGGRGLQLVAMLASRWGSRVTPEGKVVWCELPLGPGRALSA
jgi:serine phosphatase RsbU (regulator of sigma subunit)/anti-sigma regulatory factor (Ser/Thr protein kinase)